MNLKEKMGLLNFSDSQKKLMKILGIFIGIIILFIILILIIKGIGGTKVSYQQLENIMVRAAEEYIIDEPNVFKNDIYGTVEISAETLSEKGYMKQIVKYVGKDISCKAYVSVYKNLDYYDYIPKLDCGEEYSVVSLSDTITSDDNIVTTSSGLYKQTNGYVYRGEYVDNYATFSGKTWRIISIDNDGNIKLIQNEQDKYSVWDNRYNSDYGYTSGINEFEGVEASRLKDSILSVYNDGTTIKKEAKGLIVPKEYCVGKRSKGDNSKDGSTECAKTSDLMGATLLTVAEYLDASLDNGCISIGSKECSNYNYLAKLKSSFWTVTAQQENTGYAYYINSRVQIAQTSNSYSVKLVVTVNGNVNYIDGDGTKGNPYVIE